MIELCREGAAESEGNNGGLADERGSHLNSERPGRNDEAPADLVEAAPAPAPDSLSTITYPPELLPIADEPSEVIVKCICGLDWSPLEFETCPVCALSKQGEGS